MGEPAEFSRMLSTDEVADLGPLPDPDIQSPTTNLVESASESAAEVHYPGVAPAAKTAAADDVFPDPPVIEED